MNHADAHNILDAVREGANYPAHIVDQALEMTGDLDEPKDLRFAMFANQVLNTRLVGEWERAV